jgi:hypothetical protein
MTKKETILEWLEKEREADMKQDGHYWKGKTSAYQKTIRFISSLPEEESNEGAKAVLWWGELTADERQKHSLFTLNSEQVLAIWRKETQG